MLAASDIEGAVNVYHSFRDYEKLAKKFQVVAFALGDVSVPPINILTRTQVLTLTKILLFQDMH